MLVVGLTGGIASGKSTVSRMFEDAGVPVICADELAREVVKPGSAALEEIRRVFGSGVIRADGTLDRAAMASVIFENPERRKALEAIIHPKVEDEKKRRVAVLRHQGHKLVVVDVPLLYENGLDQFYDVVILVYVPQAVQEQRLAARDGMGKDAIRSRIDAQMSIEEKKRKADYVVDNTGTLDETRRQFEDLLKELRNKAADKERRCGLAAEQE